MGQNSGIYDLGDVDRASAVNSRRLTAKPAARPAAQSPVRPVAPVRGGGNTTQAVQGSLSLFLPGAGHILAGDVARGMFFLASLAFVGSLAWAVFTTLDRLTATLDLLGYPPVAAVWSLGVLYVAATLLHLGGILSGEGSRTETTPPHPVVAGAASLLLPGWGQILNGDRGRAVLFLALLWLVGASWILVSPPAQEVLTSLHLYLPAPVRLLCTPACRWTIPAVVWALAIYDAATHATTR